MRVPSSTDELSPVSITDGVVEPNSVTVPAPVPDAVPVVNDHVYGEVIALPARSVAVTDAVYVADAAICADGVNVTVRPSEERLVAPGTADPPLAVTVTLRPVPDTGSDIVARTGLASATSTAPVAGEVRVTVGAPVSFGGVMGSVVSSTASTQ